MDDERDEMKSALIFGIRRKVFLWNECGTCLRNVMMNQVAEIAFDEMKPGFRRKYAGRKVGTMNTCSKRWTGLKSM